MHFNGLPITRNLFIYLFFLLVDYVHDFCQIFLELPLLSVSVYFVLWKFKQLHLLLNLTLDHKEVIHHFCIVVTLLFESSVLSVLQIDFPHSLAGSRGLLLGVQAHSNGPLCRTDIQIFLAIGSMFDELIGSKCFLTHLAVNARGDGGGHVIGSVRARVIVLHAVLQSWRWQWRFWKASFRAQRWRHLIGPLHKLVAMA